MNETAVLPRVKKKIYPQCVFVLDNYLRREIKHSPAPSYRSSTTQIRPPKMRKTLTYRYIEIKNLYTSKRDALRNSESIKADSNANVRVKNPARDEILAVVP